ncbi:MAG TPA: glycosyltransferase family 1 protein [Planctomycetaceae bacterium]|nr:glycosyltransferase family 1 protein [Planctomycetaceae bacterium]HCK54326.1 glycosyltransferase family 1 protein [Planctomycetaceae bacterium]|tara:strand:- start:168 stop:1319 length:1152 start_codon:yes stop_codon:yes gene_type:complete
MRIVHVITRLIVGGAQENTLLTAAGQVEEFGDDVIVVTGPGAGPEGSLEEWALQRGLAVRLIPEMGRAIRPWKDWRSYQAIATAIRELSPDIVHTHSSKAGILGRAAAHRQQVPVVHTIHGAAFHFGQSRLSQAVFRQAERWAARRCQKLISVCDAMTRQYVHARIATPEMFTTIYSGMDVEPFLDPPRSREEVRAELGFQDDDIVVGKVARLFNLKGHRYLLEAASQIIEKCPRARFLLVGDGPLRDQFEARISRDGLADHFVLAGLVPPGRIPELLHATDLVVHASVWEGLARVLPQSMIAGKPVVSFEIDGAPEVVLHEETGLLVQPESVEGLIESVTRLASDQELRDRMGNAGCQRWTETFRYQEMARLVREVYQDVLG